MLWQKRLSLSHEQLFLDPENVVSGSDDSTGLDSRVTTMQCRRGQRDYCSLRDYWSGDCSPPESWLFHEGAEVIIIPSTFYSAI